MSTSALIPQTTIAELLAEHKDSISASVRAALQQRITESITWGATDELRKMTEQFIKDEIGPAVSSYLQEHRAEILGQVTNGLTRIFADATEKLVAVAAKNLESSWNVTKISDAIFK